MKTFFIWVFIVLLLIIKLRTYYSSINTKMTFYDSTKLIELRPSSPNKFVILSSSVNPRYLFLLPITVATWKKLDVQPIVVLINNNMEAKSLLKIRRTIKLLKELNVTIQYFKSKKLSPTSLSQIIRLFGSALPAFQEILTNKDILIVSDADLAVFNLSNHIPDVSNGKFLHLYNANCCKPIDVPPMRGQHKVKQYTMITIGATVKAWKEIMGFKKPFQSVDEIESYILQEFGENLFQPTDEYFEEKDKISSFAWFADQSLISYKIDEWRKNKNNEELIYEHIEPPRRINRNNWPSSEQFSQINIKDYDDCHQPTAPFENNEWKKYLPFLQLVFKNNTKILQKFSEYRDIFR